MRRIPGIFCLLALGALVFTACEVSTLFPSIDTPVPNTPTIALSFPIVPQIPLETSAAILATLDASASSSPEPAETLASAPAESLEPVEVVQPSLVSRIIQFIPQPGSPRYLVNISKPDLGCSWMGVGGQVFGVDTSPLVNIIVQVGGSLNGLELSYLTITGLAPWLGSGGYEIPLSERPVASEGSLWIELFDLNGERVSERFYLDTYEDCMRNFILVNFVSLSTSQTNRFYIPHAIKGAQVTEATPEP